MIWALGLLLALAAIALLSAPWWRSGLSAQPQLPRRAANIAAYRTRLQELQSELAAGTLNGEAFDTAKRELDARLLEDVEPAPAPGTASSGSRTPIIVAALGLLAFAAAWYAVKGNWRTQDLIELAKVAPEVARVEAMKDMAARLHEEVQKRPDDPEAWAWLGRSYRNLDRFAEAAEAFGRASALKGGQDADLLVQEGEALAQVGNRVLSGAPADRFNQALALAPDHPQALWYGGLVAIEAGEEAKALQLWERLAQQDLPEDVRPALEHSIAQLRERLGVNAPPASGVAPLALNVQVSIAPELAAEAGAQDVLFVYALAAEGPRMPLAVRRFERFTLPVQVRLDDSHSMVPTRKLSSVQRWRVLARISRSGNAAPQSGDLEGELEVKSADARKPLRLRIERRLP